MRKLLILYIVVIIILSVGCTVNRPEINDESLKGSAQIMESNEEIEEAEVIIEKDEINFYIVPSNDQVPRERLRELSANFLKVLSGYTASEDLLGPSDESFGEIYDYYDVEIIIEGYREVLDKGNKDKGDPEIQWEQ